MEIEVARAGVVDVYRMLVGLVTPRPIAWVTTRSPAGVVNLAPFSFFNLFGANPPVVVISPTLTRDGKRKDTLVNIEAGGEFVINAATERHAAEINLSSAALPPDESEVALVGLETVPSRRVGPPRLAGVPFALECRVRQIVPVGDGPISANLVIAEVVTIVVDDDVLGPNGEPDPRRIRAVARLGGDFWCRTTDVFEQGRPAPPAASRTAPPAPPPASHAVTAAQTVAECLIEQNWAAYSRQDHATWKTLFNRQIDTLAGHVCPEYFAGLETLGLVAETIPDYERMNRRLRAATGWEVVAVPGLIASRPFFTMLANRQFPAGTFIRTPEQLDYLEEPDIFHDVFGHVPLLAHPAYAAYMQAYGRAGLAAIDQKAVKFLARLNWYTIEFGLVKDGGEIKAYGAGIMSSHGEAKYVMRDPSANFLQFDLERVMRTGYYIDDFQATYFTIDSFAALFEECISRPFAPLYEACRTKPALTPFEVTASDTVLRRGTGDYWRSFPAVKTKLK